MKQHKDSMPGAPLHLPDNAVSSKRAFFARKRVLFLLLLLLIPLFFIFKKDEPYISLPNSFQEFVGREEILTQIKTTFFNTRHNKLPVIALWGEGGIGKSETAIQFANQNLKKFSLIYWVNTGSEEIYQQSYYNLAQHFNIPNSTKLPFEKVRDKVHDILENKKFAKPWLLIYDNADQYIPLPYRGHGKILVTTRDKTAWESACCMEIPPLNAKSSNELYAKVVGKEIASDWPALAQELNYFPLALYQALHYVKGSPHFSVRDYLVIAKKSKKVLFNQSPTASRYPHNLLAVWQMNATSMKAQYPQAYTWLQMCTYFHPDKIPLNWVEKWLAAEEGIVEEDVKQQANNLLRVLVNQGHIRLNQSAQSFSIHRLKQELIKQEHAGNDIFCEKALNFLAFLGKDLEYHDCLEWTDVPYEELTNWEMSSAWWLAENKYRQEDLEKVVLLLNGIGNIHVVHRGEYSEGFKRFKEALDLLRLNFQSDQHETMIYTYLNLGSYELMTCNYDSSEKTFLQVLEIVQRVYQDEPSEQLLRCYISIGMLENYRYNHDKAMQWVKKAKKIQKKLYKNKVNPEICETMKWLAEDYRVSGEMDKALKYTIQALRLNQQLLGSKLNIQRIYLLSMLGRICEALEESSLSIEILLTAYRMGLAWPDSYMTLLNLFWISESYCEQKDYNTCLKYVRKGRALANEIYPDFSHPTVVGLLMSEGRAYLGLHQPKKALECFEFVFTKANLTGHRQLRAFGVAHKELLI